jgi:WD40 repeat protein
MHMLQWVNQNSLDRRAVLKLLGGGLVVWAVPTRRGEADTPARWETARQRATLRAYKVSALAFSPNGRTLAAGCDDGTVRTWDTATWQEQAKFGRQAGGVSSLAFAPDGKTLATGTYDAAVRLWDVTAGKELTTLRGHNHYVMSVAFSPDGKLLASGGQELVDNGQQPGYGSVKLWDAIVYQEKAAVRHEQVVNAVGFSPDGKTLATASSDQTIKLWDVATGKKRASLRGHQAAVMCLAFGPDGKTLATAGWDFSIKLWDVAKAEEVATLVGHLAEVRALAFSPDGKTLASAGGVALGDPLGRAESDELKLWDVAKRQEQTSLQGHKSAIFAVTFAPDGKTLATGSWDETVMLWRPDTTP